MKSLKFNSELVPLILNGEKTSTWRLFDDKDLSEGDECAFVNRGTGEEFALARLTSVREKRLGDLTNADVDGHEKYASVEEMLATFRSYYGENVNENTMVKLIAFEIQKNPLLEKERVG